MFSEFSTPCLSSVIGKKKKIALLWPFWLWLRTTKTIGGKKENGQSSGHWSGGNECMNSSQMNPAVSNRGV